MRTYLKRSIAQAGHEVWPRLFPNLRASCAADWLDRDPSHVVAKWLGHSPKVAAQAFFMSRDHHFEDVVKGAPSVAAAIAAEGPNGVAACDAIATRNATPQASVSDSTEPHETTEPAATVEVAAGASEITPVLRPTPGRRPRKNQPAGAMTVGRA